MRIRRSPNTFRLTDTKAAITSGQATGHMTMEGKDLSFSNWWLDVSYLFWFGGIGEVPDHSS